MLTKWKTCRYYDTKIERVECSRETDKAVWVLEYPWKLDGGRGTKPPTERRRMKSSESVNYHDTWEHAHAFLMDRTERELESARSQLARAQGTHGNVKGMRKPAEPHEMPEQLEQA